MESAWPLLNSLINSTSVSTVLRKQLTNFFFLCPAWVNTRIKSLASISESGSAASWRRICPGKPTGELVEACELFDQDSVYWSWRWLIFVLASCLHNCEAYLFPRRRASYPTEPGALSSKKAQPSRASSLGSLVALLPVRRGALPPMPARCHGTFQIDASSEPIPFDGRSLEMMMRAFFFLCL